MTIKWQMVALGGIAGGLVAFWMKTRSGNGGTK